MESSSEKGRTYFAHMLVATCVVGVLPLMAVYAFEGATGITSVWVGGGLGIVLSAALAAGGAAFWRRYGSSDYVFSDLLIWGYLRHLWVERRLTRMSTGLEELLDSSVKGLDRDERLSLLADFTSIMEATDPYTRGHSRRVTRLSYMTAKTMGLPKDVIETIRTAAAVHDIGKIHVPREILNKPDRLSEEEFEIVKLHSARGADMVRGALGEEVADLIRHHHERIDGRGYPDGIKGNDIPLGARVIAVADTFDALTSTRAYRPAARHRRAIDILKKEAGQQLDLAAVNAFLRYYSGRGSLGFWATATTIPQRMIASALSWLRQVALSGVVQTAAAVGTSAALVASVPGIMPTPSPQSSPPSSASRLAIDLEEPVPAPSPQPPVADAGSSEESESGSGPGPRKQPAPEPSPTPAPSEDPSPPPPSPSPSPPPEDEDLLGTVGEVVETVVDLLPS